MSKAWFRFVFGSNGNSAEAIVYKTTNGSGEFDLILMGVPDSDDGALLYSVLCDWLGGSNCSYLVDFDAHCASDTVDKFLFAFRDFLTNPTT